MKLTREFCRDHLLQNEYIKIGPILCDRYSDGTYYVDGKDYADIESAIDAFIVSVNNFGR